MAIPAQDYPGAFVFYKMDKAGILQGLPETHDQSNEWELVAIDDGARRDAFEAKYGFPAVLRFKHVHLAFARLLAKIGYCQTLTLLDPGDFDALALPYIMGTKSNVSYIVGGSLKDQMPEPQNGFRLSTLCVGDWSRMFLIAEIRLYANTHAPAYHVVAGQVLGKVEIKRVIEKVAAKGGGIESMLPDGHHFEPAPKL